MVRRGRWPGTQHDTRGAQNAPKRPTPSAGFPHRHATRRWTGWRCFTRCFTRGPESGLAQKPAKGADVELEPVRRIVAEFGFGRGGGGHRDRSGLWVHALAAAGYQVYAINPLAVARYRDRQNLAGAKSDAGDAKVLADLVRTRPSQPSTDRRGQPRRGGDQGGRSWASEPDLGPHPAHHQLRNVLREYYPGRAGSLH